MVEVGTLSIKAQVDTTNAEQGFSRLEREGKKTSGVLKGVFADFHRLGETIKPISSAIGNIGVGITGFATALGMGSTALAPSMAKLGVSKFELGENIGKLFQPEVEKATNFFDKFVKFTEEHPKITKMAIAVGGLATAFKGLKMLGLTAFFGSLAKALTGFLAANPMIAGVIGAIAGAGGVVAVIGKLLEWNYNRKYPEGISIPETYQQIYSDPWLRTTQTGTYSPEHMNPEMMTWGFDREALPLSSGTKLQISRIAADIVKNINMSDMALHTVDAEGSSGIWSG